MAAASEMKGNEIVAIIHNYMIYIVHDHGMSFIAFTSNGEMCFGFCCCHAHRHALPELLKLSLHCIGLHALHLPLSMQLPLMHFGALLGAFHQSTFDTNLLACDGALSTLSKNNCYVDEIYYCPHHPDDQCQCRKPQPGMLLTLAARHDLDLREGYFVGDSAKDLEAAAAAAEVVGGARWTGE